MTGPGLALIIIPIAAPAGLVAWLIMVFSADSHPRQADRNPAGTQASTPSETAEGLLMVGAAANRPVEAAASGVPAGSPAPRRDPRIRQPLLR